MKARAPRQRSGAARTLILTAGVCIVASALLIAAAGAASTEDVKLTASDAAANDKFSVEVAVDSETIVVGAWRDDDNGTDSGSAYVFVRDGDNWSEQAKLTASDGSAGDEFGHTVDIDGDTIIVGAWHTDDGGTDSGSAYVFVRNGTTWSEQAKLTASDAQAGDQLGVRARISGDTAVVGAYQEDAVAVDSGSAYVFTRSGTSWNQQAKLTPSDAAARDEFGNVVSLDGDTIVVGAWRNDDDGTDSGSAYVFTRSGTSWNQQAKLSSPDGGPDDRFGGRVAVSGDTAVVGAWRHDSAGTNAGAAYVFERSGSSWSFDTKLLSSDIQDRDAFGIGAALHGDKIVIGAWREDTGGIDSGAAYVFVRDGNTWTEDEKLVASDPDAGDRFGVSADVYGETVIVGSWDDDDDGTSSGSAYVFQSNVHNVAPIVVAPADQTITMPAAATLNGSATDDGLPTPPSLTTTWSAVSGTGTVSFADPSSASTTATFSDAGVYVLKLEAFDGELTTSATVEITVDDAPPTGEGEQIFLSSSTSGVAGGIVSFADEDIVVYDRDADSWAMYFDGSDVGLTSADIDGFNIVDDTPGATVIEMTFTGPRTITGIGSIDDSDVVAFTGMAGAQTSGSFELVLDASDVGLSSGGEDVDALATNGDDYVLSTLGSFNIPGNPNLIGRDEDLIGFAAVSTGPLTSGTFSMLLDGSDVDFANEDIVSAWVDDDSGDIYGSSLNSFNVPGLSGDGDDIFVFNGTFAKYFDGDAHGFGGEQIDGLHIELGGGGPGGSAPVAVDDGPAPDSVVGDPFHIAVDSTLGAIPGSAEDLLANDTLGDPNATGQSFGGGDVGGTVVDNPAGSTVPIGTGGSLTVGTDGSFAFTPSSGFTGEFSFEYRIGNDSGSADATVTIYVGDRPPPNEAERIFLSSSTSGVVGILSFADEDIVVHDRDADSWAMYFDGSDVGLASADVDGFNIVDDSPGATVIEMTFTGIVTVPGLGSVDDSDVVAFTGIVGDDTAGSFELVLDASDVGLSAGGEDIDALSSDGNGRVLSTLGAFNVPGNPGVVGQDEDLLGFAAATTGSTTSGTFMLLFDGSDAGLAQEDIVAAWVDADNGDVYGSSLNNFNVPGLTGDGDDIFVFNGTFAKYFDGDLHGFGGEQIDGLHIELASPDLQ